jgi:hypothetical protein
MVKPCEHIDADCQKHERQPCKHEHSLANYPKEFIQCVVTRGKICLQFGDVDVKLRYLEGGEYVKLPGIAKALPIPIDGTKVAKSSVGCQLPIVFELMEDLIGALGEQFSTHLSAKEKKPFVEDVSSLADYLNHLVLCMKKEIAWKKRKKPNVKVQHQS